MNPGSIAKGRTFELSERLAFELNDTHVDVLFEVAIATVTRLQQAYPTAVSGNPKTASNITTPPKRGTIHRKGRRLITGRTARRVYCTVRVRGDFPYRIRALERGELRDVVLGERYVACFPDKHDQLEDTETSDPLLE